MAEDEGIVAEDMVREAYSNTYNQGFTDGYTAGIAAALKQIQQLASANAVPVVPSDSLLNTPIRRLKLSTRTYTGFNRADIKTIGDIYKYHDDHRYGLGEIRNFGKMGFDELNTKLVELGLDELRWLGSG